MDTNESEASSAFSASKRTPCLETIANTPGEKFRLPARGPLGLVLGPRATAPGRPIARIKITSSDLSDEEKDKLLFEVFDMLLRDDGQSERRS